MPYNVFISEPDSERPRRTYCASAVEAVAAVRRSNGDASAVTVYSVEGTRVPFERLERLAEFESGRDAHHAVRTAA